MLNQSHQKFYLLGEPKGVVAVLPSGKLSQITDFHTLNDDENMSGQAIAIYLSRLDAEIHRQYLNLQCDEGQKNNFALIEHSDERVLSFPRNFVFQESG